METLTGLQGAKLSEAAYSGSTTVEGYTLISLVSNPFINFDTGIFTGFQVALYKDLKGNYVIAFAGTDSILDGITDVSMGIHTLIDGVTSQFMQGEAIVSKWINDYPLSPSNTTIVGHSLGGALAQYFGAKTQFETLTYNAYGIGNEISGGSNITNYITMHDPVCILPQSEMIGTTYMLQDENLTAMLGHGISNFTSESSWVRGYSPVDDPRDIDVIDGIGSSGLDSAYELALMLSEGREFAMINGSMDDVIYGGEINNLLIGGSGDDYLNGGKEGDTMEGGKGFDTYIADFGDAIEDEDGEGRVIFEDARLTGGKREGGGGDGGSCDTPDGTGDNSNDSDKPVEYKGDGGIYTLEKGVLTFTKNSGEVLAINNFKNGDLGITLKGDENDPCPKPTPPTPPSPGTPAPSWPYHHGSPLVLDLNNDGTTSTFIYKTSTYFDLDNDGARERTGWVQGGDGLLTLDKNNDGIINNGNELFGNYTKDSLGKYANNGFDALTKYDDNHDGMINSSDNVYKALKVWQDSNSDGITDDGELKTLSELGISSINLSYVTADALEERNSIRETSTFTTQSTDEDGNATTQVSVVNDVWFDRDVKDTKSTTGYTQISDDIKSLGNVGGSGERMVA